jgi:hypothetical protein
MTQTGEIIQLGTWTQESIDELLRSVRPMGPGHKIAFISERFLGTPYKEAVLLGDGRTEERLVINLAELDCFTFLDYVEAFRRSLTFDDFVLNVKQVRYHSGVLGFTTRNHFFTDWIEQNRSHLTDSTGLIDPKAVQKAKKQLNRKDERTAFVPGIGLTDRDIAFLPVTAVYQRLDRLKTGDYLGIFSSHDGLDVSHTGIVIEHHRHFSFRHASSQEGIRQVVDQDLLQYLHNKPGVIVLRPC